MASRVQGLADSFSLLDGLPKAAELEAGRDLAAIGKLVLAAQKRNVPVDSGELQAGLTLQVLIGQLRVLSGIFGIARRTGKQNLGDLFYGIIVNFGRKEQTVTVTRRRVGARGLRNGRKRAEDIAAIYALHVTPLPAREFIQVLDSDPALDAQITSLLANFWARPLADVGAAE